MSCVKRQGMDVDGYVYNMWYTRENFKLSIECPNIKYYSTIKQRFFSLAFYVFHDLAYGNAVNKTLLYQ